jgi:hypothetical protein
MVVLGGDQWESGSKVSTSQLVNHDEDRLRCAVSSNRGGGYR